jgi:hypothetical protein
MADDMTALVDNQNRNSFVKTPIQFSIGVDDDCISEPMRIQLSVYSIQGICRKNFKKGGKPRHSGFTPPTTALISVRGEVVHTVVPSIPLKFNEGQKGNDTIRGSAFWQSNVVSEVPVDRIGDGILPPTFMLKRVMRRQCFQPNGTIGFMSHYQPERVDFVIGVGKGKDMYPLGIASIAISGEEEVEQLTNAPIKSICEMAGKHRSKKGHKKGLFYDGESHLYGLSNNAILRVGVRVIPEHNYIPKTVGNASVTKKNENVKFIELNDENSLIAEFKEAQEQLEKEASTPKTREHSAKQPAFGLSNCSFSFCGAIDLPFSQVNLSQSWNKKPPDVANKISEARVLSMRVMSDVSGSTIRWLTRQTSSKHDA